MLLCCAGFHEPGQKEQNFFTGQAAEAKCAYLKKTAGEEQRGGRRNRTWESLTDTSDTSPAVPSETRADAEARGGG